MKRTTSDNEIQDPERVPKAGDIWVDTRGKLFLLIESFPHPSNGAEFWNVLSEGKMTTVSTALITYSLETPARGQVMLIRLHD